MAQALILTLALDPSNEQLTCQRTTSKDPIISQGIYRDFEVASMAGDDIFLLGPGGSHEASGNEAESACSPGIRVRSRIMACHSFAVR